MGSNTETIESGSSDEMNDVEVTEEQELNGDWYVVQTLSGQEMKAQESIERRRMLEEVDDVVFKALVPMEKVTEIKQGKKTTVNKKIYPGYILINMTLYDEERGIHERVWNFINDTLGIIGFIGHSPQPLSEEEVTEILAQLERDEEAVRPKIEYEIGEAVKIKDGPFQSCEGKIEEIDPHRGRLKLSVSIFGRSAPVEVEYWQVERDE
ncbi:MAG: transcription termination/antitermination protein NusG [Lentisphaeria bacterium]|jgi:transcriptional antiterminator NusG